MGDIDKTAIDEILGSEPIDDRVVCATCPYFVSMYDEGRGQCRRVWVEASPFTFGTTGWEWVQKPDKEFCPFHPKWVDPI